MNTKLSAWMVAVALAALDPIAARAQLTVQDNFTGSSSTFDWQAFNGACLTAGNGTGNIPACVGLSYYTETLVGGTTGTLPDSAGSGALRFTNGRPGGYHQNGAIVSNFTFPTGEGLHVTFTTVTYRGDSGGSGGDGADGISFYLMDGAQSPGIGAWGGSLAYSCSNSNSPHDGLIGGYLGLGIDEYGNFLNQGDNTASGYNYVPGRIGLRGAGSVAWAWLNANYPAYYPASLSSANQQLAVYDTCKTGYLWNFSGTPSQTTTAVADYGAIPNAYKVLPSTLKIANESALTRGSAVPIAYDLKITQDGLLSFSYSYNGGASQSVIAGQKITASNGALPGSFRFGFAGSTGGSTNIHEILCFKAAPFEQSSSSAGLNQQQTAKVQTGTQVYLAFYDPSNWAGSLTSNNVLFDATAQTVSISSVANWDASCVLTGVATGQTCAATGVNGYTAPELPTSRNVLTWNGSSGIPFEWSNLTTAQKNALDAGDATPINANRLSYLRGDRSNEINSSGAGLYRARASVLGDIIDSSPTPVGAPSASFPAVWKDSLIASPSLPENAGQSYPAFAMAQQGRLNVVYAGANDGLLHGFRSGSFDSAGNYVNNSTTPNDGYEVLAYMPGAVLNNIHNNTDSSLDFSNTQYGHNFYVDATPGSGDLFYGGTWHTWLVGGLGAGGGALYALDVTNPTSANFTESSAASLVVGEWTASTLSCVTGGGGCGANLGNTYGVPQIRRFHNGMWGVIFGNGFGSSTGDAGIYVMTVDPSSGAKTFYYLSTGKSGSNDGIAGTSPLDLDGDYIVDYVYAGDLLGNVWRFDLTSSDPTKWAASSYTMNSTTPSPLFTASSGQPITSKVIALVATQSNSAPRVMLDFGTGQQIALTNASPTTYASGTQALYGIWDWNMSAWNAKARIQYASLSAPQTVNLAALQQQTVLGTYTSAGTGNQYRTMSSTAVCWQSSTQCSSGNTKFGWYLNLPGSSEQVIYDPILQLGGFIVNTTIPPANSPLSCTTTAVTGWTFAISPINGGAFTTSSFGDTVNGFVTYNNQVVAAEAFNGTGSPSIVSAGGHTFLVTQTSTPPPGANGSGGTGGGGSQSGPGRTGPIYISGGVGSRVTWVELR